MNISQSLIKSFEDYTIGKYCGDLFKGIYIDKTVSIEPTEAMKKGHWFEYLITGEKLRGGDIPMPELLKKGIPEVWLTKIPDINEPLPKIFFENLNTISASYRSLFYQAIICRKTFKYYGISDIQSGVIWTYKTEKGNKSKGILDIFAVRDGKEIIIDIKSTGFIDNRWEDFGWFDDNLHTKSKLMLQPLHYKWLGLKIFGKDIPFLFFVHSNTNSIDRKIFEINVSKETMDKYDGVKSQNKVDYIAEMVNFHLETGFENFPDVVRCSKCPLKNNCTDFIDIPRIKKITI